MLRLVQRTAGVHKLSAHWEGLFVVSKALHNNAYYLIDAQEAMKDKADRSGEETKRPWNVALLRPFYSKKGIMYVSWFSFEIKCRHPEQKLGDCLVSVPVFFTLVYLHFPCVG